MKTEKQIREAIKQKIREIGFYLPQFEQLNIPRFVFVFSGRCYVRVNEKWFRKKHKEHEKEFGKLEFTRWLIEDNLFGNYREMKHGVIQYYLEKFGYKTEITSDDGTIPDSVMKFTMKGALKELTEVYGENACYVPKEKFTDGEKPPSWVIIKEIQPKQRMYLL